MEGIGKRRLSPSSQSKMTKETGKEKVNKSKSNAKRALDTKKGPSKAKCK
jgi:hypothetical protein